jgi:hypothetical protein
MQLTTVERVKMWTPMGSTQNPSTQFDPLIRSQIAAVSDRIEAFLRRHIDIATYTEDYYVDTLARRFALKCAPIYSTTSVPGKQSSIIVANAPTVYYDPLRDFSSAVQDSFDYYVRLADGRIEFDFPVNFTGYRNPGAFRVVYTGGLAYTLDQLVATTASHTGALLAVGASVTGSLSGATGTILAYTTDTTITVKVLSGVFQVGETFTSGSSTIAFTALTTVGVPLCMAYPQIVEACNMQVSWWLQRRESQGVTSLSVEGSTVSMEKSGTLLQGVKDTIEDLVLYGASY